MLLPKQRKPYTSFHGDTKGDTGLLRHTVYQILFGNKPNTCHNRRVVSFKIISFIVHEGLKISEELNIAKLQKSPYIHLQVRHLHLVCYTLHHIVLSTFINSFYLK